MLRATRHLETNTANGPWMPFGQDLFGLPPLDANTLVGFGDAIAVSQSEDGGLFMAVGAQHSDYNHGTNASLAFQNPNGGLVRLFKYSHDQSSWDLIWSFAGDVGESIGAGIDLVNLSPTLNRIAIRRSDKVFLRDIDINGSVNTIGNDPLTTPGKLVKLNGDGTIMAVASETLNGQKGRVEVFRSSDVGLLAWELDVTFDGGTGDRLGYSLAIDRAGSRIAFGMPFNNGSTGMIRVYEYDGSEWVQVGTDLVGKSVGSLFGWSLDMSANGKTIVAGATGSYADGGSTTNARGSIIVYEEVDGVWQQVGVDLEGVTTKEQFGRAVTMDSTGTRIAASSFKYNGHKGRVKVFNYNTEAIGSWDMITEVNGEATHERMGRGLSSLAMSNNGKILAIGSPLEETGTNKTGKVLVVEEQDITSQPSGAPSIVPTVEPISEPSSQPSILPSLTPSNKPSDTKTEVPSSHPSYTPSFQPSPIPSSDPSVGPSRSPSTRPSDDPSTIPSSEPSAFPSNKPSDSPTEDPSSQPSQTPSFQPIPIPSGEPSVDPSSSPSTRPSDDPSTIPSSEPSAFPSLTPSNSPTEDPSSHPSHAPSFQPSPIPSGEPSVDPSSSPSTRPSDNPSTIPSAFPSLVPSNKPSDSPTETPSSHPSYTPSFQPSPIPSGDPSVGPSSSPSTRPSDGPSTIPSSEPSFIPSTSPSDYPSVSPSEIPTGMPTSTPSAYPSSNPSSQPSFRPSATPSALSSGMPSTTPTETITSTIRSGPSSSAFSRNSSIIVSLTTFFATVTVAMFML
eukprot:scaffold9012_cov54-Attheya_sp.AAC.3